MRSAANGERRHAGLIACSSAVAGAGLGLPVRVLQGVVRATNSRGVTVRGQVLFVLPWHPMWPGEGRLLR